MPPINSGGVLFVQLLSGALGGLWTPTTIGTLGEAQDGMSLVYSYGTDGGTIGWAHASGGMTCGDSSGAILKSDSAGNAVAATPGVDYFATTGGEIRGNVIFSGTAGTVTLDWNEPNVYVHMGAGSYGVVGLVNAAGNVIHGWKWYGNGETRLVTFGVEAAQGGHIPNPTIPQISSIQSASTGYDMMDATTVASISSVQTAINDLSSAINSIAGTVVEILARLEYYGLNQAE